MGFAETYATEFEIYGGDLTETKFLFFVLRISHLRFYPDPENQAKIVRDFTPIQPRKTLSVETFKVARHKKVIQTEKQKHCRKHIA